MIQVVVPANVSYYEITGLQRGEQYLFRSAAATSVGYGAFSGWREVIVEGGFGKCYFALQTFNVVHMIFTYDSNSANLSALVLSFASCFLGTRRVQV